MKKTWLSSDSHYGHFNVIRFCNRPFETAQEMNEKMLLWHNELVSPEDDLWYLGDFSFASSYVDTYGVLMNGVKRLVSGNHDWVHSIHAKKPQKWNQAKNRFVRAGFTVMPEQVTVEWLGKKIVLCHLPYWEDPLPGQEYEGRFKEIRPIPGDEDYLFCGHVHSSWKFKQHPSSGKIMCNVGVDVWNYRPVLVEEVLRQAEEFKNHL